jgi:hypothetical protein
MPDLFRTELFPNAAPWKINRDSRLLFYGSCFTEHMYVHFRRCGFFAETAPFGILFDLLSIARNLERCLGSEPFELNEFLDSPRGWVHPDFHGSVCADSAEELLNIVEALRILGRKQILEADFLFISPGTAFYFADSESGKPVANCHKLPAANFLRKRATFEDITATLKNAINRCRQVNPNLKVVLTLSPVKHLRDGLVENLLSKSLLRVALSSLEEELEDCYYFPSYELLTEDLRDYRFYSEDMAHPAPVAIDYISDKLFEAMVCDSTQEMVEDALKIYRFARHIPSENSRESHDTQLTQMRRLFEQRFGRPYVIDT